MTRINPSTDPPKAIATIVVGGSPQAVTIADGKAWVAVDAQSIAPTHGESGGGTLKLVSSQAVDYIGPALAYGQSQCGRFLRELLYLGLNADESGGRVLDGVYAHTGSSRRGEFNIRFGQPSTNIVRSPSTLFPMTYQAQTDPVTGQTDGLLRRVEAKGVAPKIIATNTAVEYWWSGASLAHTDTEGQRDVEPPANVRVYEIAGTMHLPGSVPLSDKTAEGVRLEYPLNTIDHLCPRGEHEDGSLLSLVAQLPADIKAAFAG